MSSDNNRPILRTRYVARADNVAGTSPPNAFFAAADAAALVTLPLGAASMVQNGCVHQILDIRGIYIRERTRNDAVVNIPFATVCHLLFGACASTCAYSAVTTRVKAIKHILLSDILW